MLVECNELTRYYGSLLAVDHVSFSIDRGEIVGLLGPNGAGKTTTMEMLTCFLPPTEGTAAIAGYDILEDPTEVRRRIGYMPENNPLYQEMRVQEYLRYRATLKGLARRLRQRRILECMELCNITDVRRQTVQTLSKGYRQRVGLADALLGFPDVLILDEPTIGLDPNQIRQTRETIRQLSAEHTVLLSTHILQEVEAICKRVLIIDRGRIVADGTPQELSERMFEGSTIVELKGDAGHIEQALLRLDRVSGVQFSEEGEWLRFTVSVEGEADIREEVFALAARRGWPLRELTRSRASLEDVFQRITLTEQAPVA